MKTVFACTVLLASAAAAAAAADVPAPEVQIAAAVLAAPAELRDDAAVLGYNAQGEVVKLREGKNELICLATDPNGKRFSVACYHRDLEPYMARGRGGRDRKSTRLNSSHGYISYAVFCLKKKKILKLTIVTC